MPNRKKAMRKVKINEKEVEKKGTGPRVLLGKKGHTKKGVLGNPV